MDTIVRRIFYGIPFIVLALLVWLCFFQHPAMDDFAEHYFTDRFGLTGALRFFLGRKVGRFTTLPLSLLFTAPRFLLDHYYIGLLFFLALTYSGIFLFLRYVRKTFYETPWTVVQYHWLTAFSLLVLLSCMPQPSSFISWVSSDTTYPLPFLLFLSYLVALHRVSEGRRRVKDIVLLTLLILLLSGANEVVLFYSFYVYAGFFLYRVIFHRERSGMLYFFMLVHIGAVLLAICMPGNLQRGGGYAQKQVLLFSIFGAFYQTVQIFFSICSNPLFWLATVGSLASYRHLKASVRNSIAAKGTHVILEILLLFLSVFALCLPVRHFVGMVLPLWARNIVVCIVAPALMLVTLVNAGPLTTQMVMGRGQGRRLWLLAGVFALLFNPFMPILLQSVLAARVHDRVLENRLAVIRRAREAGMRKVVIMPYENDFQAGMVKAYGAKGAAFLTVEFPGPPRLLFFVDEPAHKNLAPLYAEFYGMDTIQLKDQQYIRYGLTNKEADNVMKEWQKD